MSGARDGSNLRVRARYSTTSGAWLISIRHGANGPEVAFHARYAAHLADSLIDTLEAVEDRDGPTT